MRFIIYSLYQLIIFLATPLLLFRLYYKSIGFKGYRQNILERFGFGKLKFKSCIWIHAVSVGEVVAASIIIKELKKITSLPIIITTMTPTGKENVLRIFKNDKKIFHSFVPYDCKLWVLKFIKKINPKFLLIIETELWPVLLRSCNKRGVPVFLSNARLSYNSYLKYYKFKKLSSYMLKDLYKVFARGEMDAKYFKKLGVDDNKISVMGNLKYDILLPDNFNDLKKNFKSELNFNKKTRPVWVAASTHEGEEIQVLQAHKKICKSIPNALLILVPRHPNRFEQVANLCDDFMPYIKRSDFNTNNQNISDKNINILLGDSMGELLLYYSISDIAFIGGSLVPVGGHNILESFAVGTPVVVGNYQDNFLNMSQSAEASGALKIVKSSDELAIVICDLFNKKDDKLALSKNAKLFLDKHKGAALNTVKHLKSFV